MYFVNIQIIVLSQSTSQIVFINMGLYYEIIQSTRNYTIVHCVLLPVLIYLLHQF